MKTLKRNSDHEEELRVKKSLAFISFTLSSIDVFHLGYRKKEDKFASRGDKNFVEESCVLINFRHLLALPSPP